ncbi:hypothetical protein KsCSTR_44060 [Candidatus Kuenenia stuttgartiensis]|uniref:Uncharacterized protein n=1 Tax=Kuenenia stuttgartiensis TaxID=174633 RepID=Q1PWS5_KUEST|nr:hypothetical protein KsCSTR_44060 [Candidatus Kuenenia stuttgartiensis]CAJ71672.1 unknown protein [Candidatus Kuenenia stuttgartiensis]
MLRILLFRHWSFTSVHGPIIRINASIQVTNLNPPGTIYSKCLAPTLCCKHRYYWNFSKN